MASTPTTFRSGFVAILGQPNAGKSTLLNRMVGMKIAIVSDKPQTTRDKVAGILSGEGHQVVFLDMPGIIAPQDKLNEALIARAQAALEEVDVLYHLVDATDREPPNAKLVEMLGKCRGAKRLLVVNKMDLAGRRGEGPIVGVDEANYDGVVRVSAKTGRGVDDLISRTIEFLPEGPLYYDPEQLSDRDERFMAAEIVREKVFHHLHEEIPYAVFTEVETFEEREAKDFIRVVIYVERDSQKGMVIGAGGAMLKRIGQEARVEIEELTGRPAYLELWVKVRKNWRKKDFDLTNFGFRK